MYRQAQAEYFIGLKPVKKNQKASGFMSVAILIYIFFDGEMKRTSRHSRGDFFLVFRMKSCFWTFQHWGIAVIVWN